MSRSGYTDYCEGWALIRWRGAVAKALRGARGQAFLRRMLVALDALPAPRLLEGVLVSDDGCCAMGAVALLDEIDVSDLDPEHSDAVALRFGIAEAMAKEIAFENEECLYWQEMPEARFIRVRRWVLDQITAAPQA